MRLWIVQTNEWAFLEDCKEYLVYGVRDPKYQDLGNMRDGDICILRLKSKGGPSNLGYLGPFRVIDTKPTWVLEVEKQEGVWHKIIKTKRAAPRWLQKFPWCVFWEPAEEYVNDLRKLNYDQDVVACRLIEEPEVSKILGNLVQDQFLPENRNLGIRTDRGVWVRSRAEYMIDNWFARHGVVTYYESLLFLEGRKLYPDWYIPSLRLYVEFLGMKGNRDYDRSWSRKREIYEKNKMRFVTFDEGDLVNLDESIPNKIPQLKKKLGRM